MKRDQILTSGNHDGLRHDAMAIPNRTVSAAAKLIYMAIIGCLGKNDWSWPGITTLAEKTGLNDDTVTTQIQNLERAGLLRINRKSGCSHRYEIPNNIAEVIKKLRNPPKASGGGDKTEPAEPPESSGDYPPKASGIPPESSGDYPPKVPSGTTEKELRKGTTEEELLNSRVVVSSPSHLPADTDQTSQTASYINNQGGNDAMITKEQLERAECLLSALASDDYFPDEIAPLIRYWDHQHQHLTHNDIKKLGSLFESGTQSVRNAEGQLYTVPQLFEKGQTNGKPVPRFRLILSARLRIKEALRVPKEVAAATDLVIAAWIEIGRNHVQSAERLYPAISQVLQADPEFPQKIGDLFNEVSHTPWLLGKGWFRLPWLFKRHKEEPDLFNYQCVLEGRYKPSQPDQKGMALQEKDMDNFKWFGEETDK